jgi:hypothetical protein
MDVRKVTLSTVKDANRIPSWRLHFVAQPYRSHIALNIGAPTF